METLARVIFLFMIVLAPLGLLASLIFRQSARKAAAESDMSKALQLKAQSHWRLVGALVDAAVGTTGYLVVSRKMLPQIDVWWIVIALTSLSGAVHFYFIRRLDSIRRALELQTMRSEGPVVNNRDR